jgi:tRNA (cytidine/uridine-2'-O-)-methyltransferase
MLHIVLLQPQIPSNTGNIIRLCANTGAQLHLIGPLGFSLEDKKLKRAGLDYHEYAAIKQYPNYATFMNTYTSLTHYLLTSKATQAYTTAHFKKNDVLIFGNEQHGSPDNIMHAPHITQLTIPMLPHSRCLNLANSVAVVLYEALRQNHQIASASIQPLAEGSTSGAA